MTRITRRSVLASRAVKRRWSRSVSVIVEIVKPSPADDARKMPNIINFLSTVINMMKRDKTPKADRVKSIIAPEVPIPEVSIPEVSVPIAAGNG